MGATKLAKDDSRKRTWMRPEAFRGGRADPSDIFIIIFHTGGAGRRSSRWPDTVSRPKTEGGMTAKTTEDPRTDTELLVLLRDGTPQVVNEAFAELDRRWFRRLYTFLRRLLGDAGGAQDLAQETLTRVFQNAARFKSVSFPAWIYRIARNLGLSQFRRRDAESRNLGAKVASCEAVAHLACGSPSPLEEASSNDTTERIWAAIDAVLDIEQREVLLLRLDELSIAEIAKATGRTPQRVYNQLRAARVKLSDTLTRHGIWTPSESNKEDQQS
jgi:RNA polymerase sigma-70 factor (ECF subfamily)